jgi:hypothetical protein
MGAPAPKKSKREIKALLAGARRSERTVPICLRGDLVAEMQDIERDLLRLEATRSASLEGDPEAVPLAERAAALREEMLAHTVTFVVRAVARRRWTELMAAHPPREGDEADKVLGVNLDDMVEVLLRECTVEPQLDDDDWEHLLSEVLSDAQYEALTTAVWAVNTRDVSVPFSPAASRILQSSTSGSKPPGGSESPYADSTAGNPKSTPSTSTTTPGD